MLSTTLGKGYISPPEYQLFEETVAKDIAFGPKNQGLSADEIAERVRYAMSCVHRGLKSLDGNVIAVTRHREFYCEQRIALSSSVKPRL